jgi:TRAP-type transport system small permease protein
MSRVKTIARQLRRGSVAALSILLGMLVVALMLLDASQVILRYFFSRGVTWGGEVAIMMMLTLAWLGAALLWLMRAHIAVDVILGVIGTRMRRWLYAGLDLVVILAGAKLFFMALAASSVYGAIDLPALGTSAAVKFYPLIVGTGLIVLAGIINLLADWGVDEG